jgi:hypothetical protein
MGHVIPHDLVLQVSARLKPKPEVAPCTFNACIAANSRLVSGHSTLITYAYHHYIRSHALR